MSFVLSDRVKWLLALIKLSGGYVEGATRLQKLTFLVSQEVKELKEFNFYKDWVAGKYGPFSKNLSDDVSQAIADKIIWKGSVKNDAGYPVDHFSLTDTGVKVADETVNQYPKIKSKVEDIVKLYAKSALMSLLHDVYYQYPQYTSESAIKGSVAGKTGFTDTPLDPSFG